MDPLGKSKLTLAAPAKVNLRLKITGRRGDGYHLLDMVMVKLDLADEVVLELGGLEIVVECPEVPHLQDSSKAAGPPTNFRSDSYTSKISALCGDVGDKHTNTVWRAAEAVRRESGRRFGLKAFLRKGIPIAAGLGGGSSDAATTLMGLNILLELGWDQQRLIEVGTRIGADVPFFLVDGPQKVGGIGEVLEPITLPPLHLILINPGFPVSTAEAYRWWDETSPLGEVRPPLTEGVVDASLPPLENDLEGVVIPRYPVLAEIKGLFRKVGALGALMSGSGPTVFGVFESPASRDRGYEILLKGKDPKWWVWKGGSLLGGEESNLD